MKSWKNGSGMKEIEAEGRKGNGFFRIWDIYAAQAMDVREVRITILSIIKSF